MNLSDGWSAILAAAARALEPDPELHIDQWSEENIILVPPVAHPGPYRIAHTPMARRVMQVLSPGHPATRVIVRGASQMLKTQVFINACLAWIAQGSANILALEPTDKLAKRLSGRIAKAIDACDTVKPHVAKPRSRDSKNTIDCKEFDGGALYITTAGSAANMAEIPARHVFLDEVDRMDDNVNGEGNVVEIASARTTTYDGCQKVYIASSPTVQGSSKIDDEFSTGTQEHYHVPCPHCGTLHELVDDNFRYSLDPLTESVDRAWFVCPDCGAEIDEDHKSAMLADEAMGGRACWVATAPGDGQTISFHVNAFLAPIGSITWQSLARQKHRALAAEQLGNFEPKRVWTNTRLALSYAYESTQPKADELRNRALAYAENTVPAGGLLLTAGVDVQHDRLALAIRAWGRAEESWLVYWGEIFGSTADAKSGAWVDLDAILTRSYPSAYGAPLHITAVSIDGSDGNRTEVVHDYVRPRRARNHMVVKGHAEQTSDRKEIFSIPRPVDPGKANKKTARHGLVTHMVGTARAKDTILDTRIGLTGTGPGRIHAYAGVRADYWDQLTSEVKIPTGPSRRMAWTKKGGARNEALDCEVMALHAARSRKTNLMVDAHWSAIEARLRQKPLLDPADPALAAPQVDNPEATDPPEAPDPAAESPAPIAQTTPPPTTQVQAPAQPQATRRPAPQPAAPRLGGWSAARW